MELRAADKYGPELLAYDREIGRPKIDSDAIQGVPYRVPQLLRSTPKHLAQDCRQASDLGFSCRGRKEFGNCDDTSRNRNEHDFLYQVHASLEK